MHFLKFKIFEKFRNVLKHGLSTREGGVSGGEVGREHLASLNLGQFLGDSEENLHENYKRFCGAVGVDEEKLVMAEQEHGDGILILKNDLAGSNYGRAPRAIPSLGLGWNRPIKGYDGFMTDVSGVPLFVRFADCQGVLFFDPVRRVIAAVHSGWRGNVKNILGKCVRKMVEEFGCKSSDIFVGISQSLGPCCAEFSEPAKELPEWMRKYIGGEDGRHVDLWKCSFDQLVAEGVRPENVEIMRRCTVCENDIFFSYRGGKKKTGHMGAVIELRQLI